MTPGWARSPTRAARRRKCCAFSTPHLRNLRLIGRIVVGFFQFAIELSTFTVELITLCKACTFHLPSLHKHTIFSSYFVLFFFFNKNAFQHFPTKGIFWKSKKQQETRVSIRFIVGSRKHGLPSDGNQRLEQQVVGHRLPSVPGHGGQSWTGHVATRLLRTPRGCWEPPGAAPAGKHTERYPPSQTLSVQIITDWTLDKYFLVGKNCFACPDTRSGLFPKECTKLLFLFCSE